MIITERCLMARINRRLSWKNQRLCKSRLSPQAQDAGVEPRLGWFYVVDTNTNRIDGDKQDLIELAKELGCLHKNETLDLS